MTESTHWVNAAGSYQGEVQGEGFIPPEDWVQVPTAPENWEQTWSFDLSEWYWEVSPLARLEREWRATVWADADIGLMKAQEGASSAVGTVQNWIDYKENLRTWPEHPNFPYSTYRPTAPV